MADDGADPSTKLGGDPPGDNPGDKGGDAPDWKASLPEDIRNRAKLGIY